jgi:hypothetical protein
MVLGRTDRIAVRPRRAAGAHDAAEEEALIARAITEHEMRKP